MTSGTEGMRVTTVEEADAVRFLKHEAEKRAVTAGGHGPLGHHAAQAAQGPLGHGQAAQAANAAQRNLMAAFNAA
jgi:hypothetical protein